MVAAATKMRTLVTDDYFEPDALSVSYAQSITNFNAGKAAMYPMGSWYLGSIPKNEWNNIGVFPWPTDNGSLVIPFSLGGSMAVSSKTPDSGGRLQVRRVLVAQPGQPQVAHLRRRRLPDAQGQVARQLRPDR